MMSSVEIFFHSETPGLSILWCCHSNTGLPKSLHEEWENWRTPSGSQDPEVIEDTSHLSWAGTRSMSPTHLQEEGGKCISCFWVHTQLLMWFVSPITHSFNWWYLETMAWFCDFFASLISSIALSPIYFWIRCPRGTVLLSCLSSWSVWAEPLFKAIWNTLASLQMVCCWLCARTCYSHLWKEVWE